MNALRREVDDEGHLTDEEIIDLFVPAGSDIDYDCESECICGKQGIKWIYYIKFKKSKQSDLITYATTNIIVGSECIQHWWKSQRNLKKKKKLKVERRFYLFSYDGTEEVA